MDSSYIYLWEKKKKKRENLESIRAEEKKVISFISKKKDLVYYQGKWATVENGVQDLRELSMLMCSIDQNNEMKIPGDVKGSQPTTIVVCQHWQ